MFRKSLSGSGQRERGGLHKKKQKNVIGINRVDQTRLLKVLL